MWKVRDILNTYEASFGQAINFQKFGIFFSSYCLYELRHEIFTLLHVFLPLNHGRYLGLSSLIGGNEKHVFSYSKDRL